MEKQIGSFIAVGGIIGIVIFIIVIGFFGFLIYKGIKLYISNNNSPLETRAAKIISKRTEISTLANDNITTWYYATFELDDKERIEFALGQTEYGILAEGDEGELTYQGTRFKSFDRNI